MVFKSFRKKFAVSHTQVATEELFAKYEGKLPSEILTLWKEDGLSSYGEIMWFVNPDEYVGEVDRWLVTPDHSIVFARSGFGDLFTWNGKAIYQLFIHTGAYGRLMRNIEVYMETMMLDEAALNDSHYLLLQREAQKKLGHLTTEECFTFANPLISGGKESVENVVKANHKQELMKLAALHRKLTPS